MPEALTGAPLWVWPLLAYVIWVGLRATRPRTVTPMELLALPLVFAGLVVLRAATAANPLPALAAGAVGGLIGVGVGLVLAGRSGATRDPATGRVRVPGTPFVLVTSLAFFALQWAAAYYQARHPGGDVAVLAKALSAGCAGLFLGRAAGLLRTPG
jgi:hypothetical protein